VRLCVVVGVVSKKGADFSIYNHSLIAAALEANCNILYSEDMQNGQIIENTLRIVNPFCSLIV
jgi:predicted nucleic acid-binding protein